MSAVKQSTHAAAMAMRVSAAGLLLAAMWLLCGSAQDEAAPASAWGPAEVAMDPGVINVTAWNAEGGLMADGYLQVAGDKGWASFSTGDPISLEHAWPLSLKSLADQADIQCEGVDPSLMGALSNTYIVARHPEAAEWCPYPVYPAAPLYYGQFADGVAVIARFETDKPVAILKARTAGETIELAAISEREAARMMVEGVTPEEDMSHFIIESRISRQECVNMVASETKQGQQDQLVASARLIAELLELYRGRSGEYPAELSQLYTGADAVCGGPLHNPYRISDGLGLPGASQSGTAGAIQYIPELSAQADGTPVATGYWLAVLGQGDPVEPTTQLPAELKRPQRVILWIEQHSLAAGD